MMLMQKLRSIGINAAKRILKVKKSICGGIITGTDKIRSGFGNGDCLLFDFDHMVFAVADGTERFPWASRDLLRRLSESLSRTGAPASAQGWKALINGEVYSEQKYQHKTTFSCVAIRSGNGGVDLIISHGGDSSVTVMDSKSGAVYHQTGRDMNFGGRSREIVEVSERRMTDPNSRVVISTDGFNDLLRYCVGRSILASVDGLFTAYPVDSIGEVVFGIIESNRGKFEHDDIGFIVIDPFLIERVGGPAVLIGGTRPHEEKRYQEEYPHGPHDRWISGARWLEYAEVFAGAGIQVQ
jgi:hypothetical protein